MRNEAGRRELETKTQELLQGPLKHVRTAVLAAALVPLAAVAATPAYAQGCASGGICGTVWEDVNGNGIQDTGELGIEGAVVTLSNGDVTATDSTGYYEFTTFQADTYEIAVQIPPGMEPSPADQGGDDTLDSDGTSDGLGNSVATFTYNGVDDSVLDFGFFTTPMVQPGTGTPGYWKNHPEAWPVSSIEIGGVTYSEAEALTYLDMTGKDKTVTMFSSLLSAMLNVMIGNDDSCVSSTIAAANQWMATYGPVGSGVAASSYAWKIGEPLHRQMDNYNNGMLCAPHRD